PIRHWEVDNEPDLKNSLAPKGAVVRYDPKSFCLPDQYARVLLATSKAIKAADPGAFVLNGGLYRPHTPQGAAYMRSLFAVPGVLDAIDGVSIHAYFSSKDDAALDRAVSLAEELAPGKPVWITETSVPAVSEEAAHVNEDYQAQTLARVIALALQRGVAHVFWHSLNDPPNRPPGHNAFWSNSLYRAGANPGDPLTMKPAGYAYQALAQALAEVPRDQVVAAADKVQIGAATLVLDGQLTVDPAAQVALRLGEPTPAKVSKVKAADGPTLVRPASR
ncbi:glycosyl hydrolase, partial [Myxococcota bacterium]|nr:glycosyl hydrolase [Myxococcota bacterium]